MSMATILKNVSQEKKPAESRKSKIRKTSGTVSALEQQNESALRSGLAFENPNSSRPEDILSLQRQFGNQAVSGLIQAKLKVGPVGDSYEQEADRMADRVMSQTPASMPEIQRKKNIKPVQNAEDDNLMMKPQGTTMGGFEAEDNIEKRINSKIGNGSALPKDVRSFMEERFQKDFSGVHVHADSEAAGLNQDLQAKAFTRGHDLFFNAGAYQPGTTEGNRLIAHELTHVVQQSGGSPAAVQRKPIWEELTPPMTEAAWKALPEAEKRSKLRTGHRTDAISSETVIEKAGGWTGGNIANSIFGVANLGLGIESTREGDNSETATSAVSIGVTGLQTLATGVSFAGSAATMHRGRMMRNRGSQAGRMVGNRMMRRSGWAMGQQIMGMGSGVAGMTSSGISIAGNNAGSNVAGGISSVFSGIGSALGIAQGGISLNSARRRSNKAKAFAGSADPDLKFIAQQTASSQGKTVKSVGILGNVLGGISSIFGAAKGFGQATGVGGQVLGGLSVGLGFLGTAAGSLGGILNFREKRAQQKKLAAINALPAQIAQTDTAIAQIDAQLATVNTSITAEEGKLATIVSDIGKKDAEIAKAKVPADRTKLTAEKAQLEQNKTAQAKVVADLKAKKVELERQKTALAQKKTQMEAQRVSGEHEKLAYDSDAAAQKLIDGISKEPPDANMVKFVEEVLGVKPAVEIILRDPVAAKELLSGKLNKN
jgi:hypothetical protein